MRVFFFVSKFLLPVLDIRHFLSYIVLPIEAHKLTIGQSEVKSENKLNKFSKPTRSNCCVHYFFGHSRKSLNFKYFWFWILRFMIRDWNWKFQFHVVGTRLGTFHIIARWFAWELIHCSFPIYYSTAPE